MECHGKYILKISPVAPPPVVDVPLLALLPEQPDQPFSRYSFPNTTLVTSMSSSILTKSTLSPRSPGKQESRVSLSSSPSRVSLKYSPETMVKKTTKDNRLQQGGVAEKDRRSDRSSDTANRTKEREETEIETTLPRSQR
ncbi:hypothetical protein M9H77_01884 [Catharanthus roseus]|uniref:Uncharacterized protein n=1 Tax=Catharanthus roseus TaxID=4058 RepID=A0ACC0C707_CATRO|nr:hypothetical protein M9H77_01884 [Catharanthus roseus]